MNITCRCTCIGILILYIDCCIILFVPDCKMESSWIYLLSATLLLCMVATNSMSIPDVKDEEVRLAMILPCAWKLSTVFD